MICADHDTRLSLSLLSLSLSPSFLLVVSSWLYQRHGPVRVPGGVAGPPIPPLFFFLRTPAVDFDGMGVWFLFQPPFLTACSIRHEGVDFPTRGATWGFIEAQSTRKTHRCPCDQSTKVRIYVHVPRSAWIHTALDYMICRTLGVCQLCTLS